MKAPAAKPVKKALPHRRAFAAPSNRAAAAFGAGSKPENPFDKFANARKKHEVLNRRVKGEDRNMGRAREKAIDERKTKLLKDLQSTKKSNVIVDKRFGESDPTMSLEEKMFLRFQREKAKSARNSSIFNLDAGDTEVLTHKGQILGASNLQDEEGWISSDDEDGGGRLNKQVVDSLHFGGGFEKKRNSAAEEAGLAPKGRLDALQEIVMKSKLAKMQKKEAREEQEDERTKLDHAYKELFSSSMLDFNPTGAGKFNRAGAAAGGSGAAAEMDDYDLALREMTYEAKLPASERTKTAEEIALEEQKRIEELEAARLKRMKAPMKRLADEAMDNADADAETDKPLKRKARTDDEIDDSAFDTMAARGKRGRAGREEAAREAEDATLSGAAYRDYILQDDEYSDSDGDGDEDEDEEEDGEEDGEEDSEDGSDGEEEEDDDSEPEGEGEGEGSEDGSEGSEGAEGEDEEWSDDQEEDDIPAVKKGKAAPTTAAKKTTAPAVAKTVPAAKSTRQPTTVSHPDDGVNIEMPHKIDCPPDLEAFDELVDQYVRNGNVDMRALIDRIVAWNNVHLPGAEGKENRNLMHNFLDVLLKHFTRVGDFLSELVAAQQKDSMDTLDYLSGVIFKICTDLGEQSCAALWGRTIKILHAQLQKRLRDYAQGERANSCWPSLGRLLMLQLLGRVFSVTDLRNDVVGPATLFLCQCLSQCPVATTQDVASGLLAASVVTSCHSEAKRYVPEVVTFVHTVFSLYLPSLATPTRPTQNFLSTFSTTHLASLRQLVAESKSSAKEAKVQWFVFSSKAETRAAKEGLAATSLLIAAYALFDAVIGVFEGSSALPEIVEPVLVTLRAVRPQSKPTALPAWVQERHLATLERAIATTDKVRSTRQPLQWRKTSITSIETKAPRFQLDYTFKKDADPDQDRAKVKQLTRQLKREKKAAMRELRRDSDFIDQERYKEQQAAKEFRRAERVKNFAFMEEQQATINLQVRQGKGLMKGGGSSVAKKARIKRL